MAPGQARTTSRMSRLRPATAAALCLLGACSHLPRGPFSEPPADMRSPIAGDLKQLDLKTAAYPSFLQVPSQPTDVRPTTAWNRNIFATLESRRVVRAQEVVTPQTLYGAEAFAQEQRNAAAPPLTDQDVKAQTDATTDFTRSGHARATPPSPAR